MATNTSERGHGSRWAILVASTLIMIPAPTVAVATGERPITVSDATTATTEPDTSEPDTSEPDTEEVETGEADPTGSTGAPPDEDDDATTLTWIAVGLAVALLGVAVWWMVRGGGSGEPVRRMDDDWPSDSEVI